MKIIKIKRIIFRSIKLQEVLDKKKYINLKIMITKIYNKMNNNYNQFKMLKIKGWK